MQALVKFERTAKGLHPSQASVIFSTIEGTKEIILDRSFLTEDHFTAFIIRRDGSNFLVELPSETSDGCWRVTVPAENVRSEQLAA